MRTEQGFRRCIDIGLAEGKRKDTITQEESEQFAWEVIQDISG